MFKALFKSRMLALSSWLFSRSSSKSGGKFAKLKLVGFVLILAYAGFAFMTMFGMYFGELAKAFFPLGLGWLYFTLFLMAALLLMFIGSVFVTKAQLYETKDNDFLLSMPIPPSYILGSRMLMLLVFNYLLEFVVAAPALVMWLRVSPASVLQLLAFVLLFLFLPLLALALSSFFGWLLELVTGRFQKNSLITVLFSLIFLGAYMYFFSRANVYIQQLILDGNTVADSLGAISPLFWMGNAVAAPNLLHLLLILLLFTLPFLLVYWVLSITFLSLATTKRSAAKKQYKEQVMRPASLSSALLRREFNRLLGSPSYMLNAGLGLLFILVAGGALIVKRETVLTLISQLGIPADVLLVLLVLGFCLMASMVNFTASSVSLEGKSLWIIKSLPVPYGDALKAKLNLQVRLTVPPLLLAAAAAAYTFSLSNLDILGLALSLVFYAKLSANLGLIANLQHVKLDWSNETQAIKQSISVLLSMLYSSMIVLLPGALYFMVLANMGYEREFLWTYTLLLLLGSLLTDRLILTKGAKRFGEIA